MYTFLSQFEPVFEVEGTWLALRHPYRSYLHLCAPLSLADNQHEVS